MEKIIPWGLLIAQLKHESTPEQDVLFDAWIKETDNGRICLTSEGMGYSDYIGQLFVTSEIRQLMETYSY